MSNHSTSGNPLPQLISELPLPVALVVSEYLEETNPYLKLHRLVDTAEMITRFFCVITVNDVYIQLGRFPYDLRHDQLRKLRQPTFGRWKDILAAALQTLADKKGSPFITELPRVWDGIWADLIGNNQGDLQGYILPLRNHLAHVGRLSGAHAQELLVHHRQNFEDALERLAFLEDYQLVALGEGTRPWLLQGKDAGRWQPDASVFPNGQLANGVHLVHGNRSLRLYPLHLYDTVSNPLEVQEHPAGSHAVPLLYLQYDQGHRLIEYTAFDPEVSFAQRDRVVESFFTIFDLDTWDEEVKEQEVRKKAKNELTTEFNRYGYDFDDLEREFPALRSLKGRRDRLTEVQNWIFDSIASGGGRHIVGKPGVGKTAFMLGLWERIRSDGRFKSINKMRFFFRAGDARCSLTDFYRAATLRLTLDYKLDTGLGDDFVVNPAKRFREALIEAQANRDRAMLFLVDGIDELGDSMQDFLDSICDTVRPGVIWVIASRRVSALSCDVKRAVLPPLDEKVIRAWVIEELGELKYALMERDEEQEDRTYGNPFIDTLTVRAAGLPLYVRHVIDDLKYQQLTVYDEALLPRGLSEYYKVLLARLQVGDEAQMLTDILAVLLVAFEPLDSRVLLAILNPLYGYVDNPQQLLDSTLQRAQPLLHRRSTQNNRIGWTLYHETLREHLSGTSDFNNARARAEHYVKQWCSQWQGHKELYAMRNYARHLAASGDWDDLRSLLLPQDGEIPWAEARHAEEGTYAGYISDLKRLEQRASQTKDLALLIECRLGQATALSISDIPPELLAYLAEVGTTEGRWSMDQVLRYVSVMPSKRRDAAVMALAAIEDKGIRRELGAYAQGLADREDQERILQLIAQAARDVDSVSDESGVQHSAGPNVDVEEALAFADAALDDLPSIKIPLDALPDEHLRQRISEIREIEDRERRRKAGMTLIRQIQTSSPKRRLRTKLGQTLATISSDYQDRVKSLIDLLPRMEGTERRKVIAKALETARKMPNYTGWTFNIDDGTTSIRGSRAETLAWMLPYLSSEQRMQVLGEIRSAAQQLAEEPERTSPYLKTDIAESQADYQRRALLKLIPHLPKDHQPYIVELALLVQQPSAQEKYASALAALLPFADEDIQSPVIEIALGIDRPRERVKVLTALIPHLDCQKSSEAIDTTLVSIDVLQKPMEQASALAQVAILIDDPQRSTKHYQRALDLAYEYDPLDAIKMIVDIAPELPEALFERTLDEMEAGSSPTEDDYSIALSRMAPHLPMDLFARWLTLARQIDYPPLRIETLESFIPRLRGDKRLHLALETLGAGLSISKPDTRIALLLVVAPFCDGILNYEVRTALCWQPRATIRYAQSWIWSRSDAVRREACAYYTALAEAVEGESAHRQALEAVKLLCDPEESEKPESPLEGEDVWLYFDQVLDATALDKLLLAIRENVEALTEHSSKDTVTRIANVIVEFGRWNDNLAHGKNAATH